MALCSFSRLIDVSDFPHRFLFLYIRACCSVDSNVLAFFRVFLSNKLFKSTGSAVVRPGLPSDIGQ